MSRRSGDSATNPASAAFSRIALADVEDLGDYRLFVGDRGIAGLSGLPPEGAVIGHRDLGLRCHPGLGALHGFPRRIVQRRRKIDPFGQQPWRNCDNDMSCRDLDSIVAHGKAQHDMIAAVIDVRQDMLEMKNARRQIGLQRIDQLRHAALQTVRAR